MPDFTRGMGRPIEQDSSMTSGLAIRAAGLNIALPHARPDRTTISAAGVLIDPMHRWRIAFIVSAAIAISYLDRQTLPVAIGEIRREIPISNQMKALLDSAFLLTYGVMYVVGGRLLDRLGTRRGFLIIMIFWSIACASHGLALGVGML